MSAMVWEFNRDDTDAIPLAHEGILTMKGLIVGMMFCMAAGAEGFVFIPDGTLSLQQQFFFGLIAGTIGTLVGLAIYGAANITQLARQALANLGLAALFAPLVAWAVCGKGVDVMVLAPIAGTLGIGGSVLFEQIWPMVKDSLANRVKSEAKKILGENVNEPH